MSTTDSKQVTPAAETKLSKEEVQALREKRDQLSASITKTVLDTKADLPKKGSAQQLRSEHKRLTEEAKTAKQQAEQLHEAKGQLEPLAQECQGLEKELTVSRESLSEFYQPLGAAAFEGQLAEQIQDVSALSDRLALHEKITQMQQESGALTPSADAKMLEKTKAKAQQLAAAGKIKIEQTKIGKLDKQSGQQLISEQQEDSVSCEATSAILEQISGRRAEISDKAGKVAESTASFASSRDEVTKKLDLPPFETVAELDIQIKENNKLTASAQKQLTLLERELPDRLIADEELRSSDSELGQQVLELAEIQAQLKTAGSALDNVKEGLGQFATKIKDVWGGLSTRGKAITVGVIVLIAISAAMTMGPGDGNTVSKATTTDMDLDTEDPGPGSEDSGRGSEDSGRGSVGGNTRRPSSVPGIRKEKRVKIGAGDVTIRDDMSGISHVKIECNSGLVIDADWKRNSFNDFGYDIYEPTVNRDTNRFAVMTLTRTVIANYLNGKYD